MNPARGLVGLVAVCCCFATPARAQRLTAGAGVLLSDRSPELVAELHAASAPFLQSRVYATASWTNDSGLPTMISAAERQLTRGRVGVGLGAGLLWLEANDYRPYPIVVGSAVLPIPLPRASLVAIGSSQPFQDFAWSLVLKAAVLVWSGR